MKTHNKLIYLLFLLLFLVASCSDSHKESNVESITICNVTADGLSIGKHETFQVEVETSPSNQEVAYYSSNSVIFTVNSTGLITAKSPGTASLYVVNLNGETHVKTACEVTVIGYVESIGVQSGVVLIVDLEETVNISSYFTAYPLNATKTDLKYTPSVQGVVSIDEEGNLKSLAKGVVEVTASPMEGNTEMTSESIKVYSGYKTVEISKQGWSATASEQYSSYYAAGKIVDGSTSTFWRNNTNNPNPPYTLLVDMKAPATFNKLSFLRHSTYIYARTIQVYISDETADGIGWDDASFHSIGKVEFLQTGTLKSLDFWIDAQTYTSRYLKLVLPDTYRDGWNALSEIYVYNVD